MSTKVSISMSLQLADEKMGSKIGNCMVIKGRYASAHRHVLLNTQFDQYKSMRKPTGAHVDNVLAAAILTTKTAFKLPTWFTQVCLAPISRNMDQRQ
jgi:hypothetical protein